MHFLSANFVVTWEGKFYPRQKIMKVMKITFSFGIYWLIFIRYISLQTFYLSNHTLRSGWDNLNHVQSLSIEKSNCISFYSDWRLAWAAAYCWRRMWVCRDKQDDWWPGRVRGWGRNCSTIFSSLTGRISYLGNKLSNNLCILQENVEHLPKWNVDIH